MAEQLYTQGDVNRIFGEIPSRTLRFWVESGLVEWAGEHEDRRGKHRQYSFINLVQLGLVEELMGLNMPVKIVKGIMQGFFLGKSDKAWEGLIKGEKSLTLLLGKEKKKEVSVHEVLFEGKKEDINVFLLPGWRYYKLIPTQDIGKELNQNLMNLNLLVMLNLENIIEKVNLHIKQALIE
jgi:DNA-binding transcriptional MerR regulator